MIPGASDYFINAGFGEYPAFSDYSHRAYFRDHPPESVIIRVCRPSMISRAAGLLLLCRKASSTGSRRPKSDRFVFL
jgi:hypothetical protein